MSGRLAGRVPPPLSNTDWMTSIPKSVSSTSMVPLNLTDLRHFLLLAEDLHFGRTAERIGVAQPVLTRRINRLEEAVGASLFERTSRSVALTQAGRRLRDEAGSALKLLDAAVGSAREDRALGISPLRVGYFAAAETLLRPMVAKWREILGCEVQLFHLHSPQQVARLRGGTIDLGFLRPPVSRGALELHVIRHERVVCVLPAGHRLAAATSLRLRQVAGETLIRFSPAIGTVFQRRIEAVLRRQGIPVTLGQSVEHTPSVQSLVAMGEGIALLPGYVAEAPRPGIAYVPVEDLPASIPLAMAWRSDTTRREVLRAIELSRVELSRA
jgi:DNA-binding transcriptional LysR family regulator